MYYEVKEDPKENNMKEKTRKLYRKSIMKEKPKNFTDDLSNLQVRT